MFNYFSFDPASLNDEELLIKQQDLQAKVVWASRFGSGEMIEGLQRIIGVIEAERMERYARSVWVDQQAMFPAMIETDPDLKQPGDAEPGKPDKKITPQSRPRLTVTRSARPTSNSNPDT